MPASAAIASDVGHGALGLRDNLRPFSELLEESAGQRHLWVEARGQLQVRGWNDHDASTSVVVLEQTFDGVRRDVLRVATLFERLSRAESLADCVATEGTFFYDGRARNPLIRWDDGVTKWDSGAKWDRGPAGRNPWLYVHLTGGADPAALDVFVEFGFFFGSHGVWQPTLGVDKLTDGGLEAWTSPTDLASWTEFGVGGAAAVTREASEISEGTYAAKMGGGIPATTAVGLEQLGSVQAGHPYRVSGRYMTPADNDADVSARLRLGYASAYLQADGRTATSGTAGFALADTHGRWRRFAFDFVAPGDSSFFGVRVFAYNAGGSASAGSVHFDGLSFQAIHRYEYYEPRLSVGDVPQIEAARADGFFGPISTSLGTLSLTNGDGYMEKLFGAFDWRGATFVVKVGGRFPRGGNEVLADDLHTITQARAHEPEITDRKATVRLEDLRSWFRGYLPRRKIYDGISEDKPRPLLLGYREASIKPPKVAETANGYGVYEVADCDDWSPGIHQLDASLAAVRVYVDEEAARRQAAAGVGHYLCSLSPFDGGGPDYAVDLAAGRVTILRDVTPVQLTFENCLADFNIGGDALVANLSAHVGLCEKRRNTAARLEAAMNTAAGVSDISVTYDDATHTYTVAKGAGALELLTSTGANRDVSIWSVFGFDSTADRTGALSYEADAAVFESPERNHILRVDASGYADDAAGSYTGSAGDWIRRPPDMVHFFLREVVGIPEENVNAPSFVAARAAHSELDGAGNVYVGAGGQTVQIADVLERMETAFGFELVMREGVFHWKTRDAPGTPVTLVDRDYLSFSGGYDQEDYASTVLMRWLEDPATGGWRTREQSSDAAVVQFGRKIEREFVTILTTPAGAALRFGALVAEVLTKRRRFRLAVKGRALQKSIGDEVRLVRQKGLDASGALDGTQLFRIVGKRDDWARWVSELVVIEKRS